jgi:3'(2'), 5'-bisphosphate nucleotidase
MIALTQALLQQIEQIALAAGDIIMHIYQKDFAVDVKTDHSPLTEADTQASAYIVQQLRQHYPHISVLSEESSEFFDGNAPLQEYFLVDPLDGTKEFIKKNGEFTVNIALIQQGRAVLGVVYAPAMQQMYSAAQGLGAFKSLPAPRKPIQVQPCQQPVRVMVSRSHLDENTSQFLQQFVSPDGVPPVTIPMGSSFKLCKIAEGEADIYPRFGPTSLWDTAAAQAVLEQAGGVVVDLQGQPLQYGNPAKILNPSFIAAVNQQCFQLPDQ